MPEPHRPQTLAAAPVNAETQQKRTNRTVVRAMRDDSAGVTFIHCTACGAGFTHSCKKSSA